MCVLVLFATRRNLNLDGEAVGQNRARRRLVDLSRTRWEAAVMLAGCRPAGGIIGGGGGASEAAGAGIKGPGAGGCAVAGVAGGAAFCMMRLEYVPGSGWGFG